ncbi:MAG: glycosyltransferase family 39 protein [Deltaproteobacteria bacterium]|nr:glycosyltransferase family 39 protein [Deltaproteobacteria bacterium]
MAWGFAKLGLHDWAGRLPLALWGLCGALVLYVFLARMVSPRAGLYGVVALSTMPLYFVQSRTMLGDIVTMAAFTLCFCGLGGALLDRRSWWATAGWLTLGLAGAASGYLSRGALIGVAAPALGVGATWLVLATSGAGPWVLPFGAKPHIPTQDDGGPKTERPAGSLRATVVGVAVLALGVGAATLGVLALVDGGFEQRQVLRTLGVAIQSKAPVESTFELTVRDLGHALFPWSAFLPFAFGRLFRLPADLAPEARLREVGTRTALLVGSAVAYGVFALLAPYTGPLPFAAPALLAAVGAIAIVDFERGAPPSGVLGVGTLILGVVLLRDITKIPVKGLTPFSVVEKEFPKTFEATGASLMTAAAAVFCGVVLFVWLDRPKPLRGAAAVRAWFDARVAAYRKVGASLLEVWRGNLVFGFLVVEAALVGLGGMVLVGQKLGWASVVKMPRMFAYASLNLWWVVPLCLPLIFIAIDLGRLVTALVLSGLRLTRAAGTLVAALGAGALLCFGYYPALAGQLSPKEAFESYARTHEPGQPLGVLGLRARVARYYSGEADIRSLGSPRAALQWLDEGTGHDPPERRFVVLRRRDLAELNSIYRKNAGQNLPVLDLRSGQNLLASNTLAGASNQNPLDRHVLAAPPESLQHPLDVTFKKQLVALGWEVADRNGTLVDYVVPGRTYAMRFYYRVRSPITRTYQVFVHIDGYGRRHNGDHDVLGGDYRMTYWRVGDVIMDEYSLTLEPNFLPGQYTVYFGFFAGKQRFKVSRGKHHDNRVNGGTLTVR